MVLSFLSSGKPVAVKEVEQSKRNKNILRYCLMVLAVKDPLITSGRSF